MESGNRIVKNSMMALLYEIIAIIAGLIVPRLILGSFGSSYNGIVSSVTQFLSFIVLLRAGIGGVAKTHLYKSLKENDNELTSQVMHAVKDYMDRVCAIFAISLIIMSCVYPYIVSLPWLSTAVLVLICGLSSLAENYFGITNMILLQADRKDYVISIGNIASTITNLVVTIILIHLNCSIHIVKLGTAISFSINPIFLWIYNRINYQINYNSNYDKKLLAQTKDAFVHVVAEFIHRNTDVIILTVMTNTLVVSVYSVHAIIVNGLRKLTNAFTANIESVLGGLYNDEKKLFENAFLDFEFAVFIIGIFTYACCGILISPFIKVYTQGINDINYVVPIYGLLISIGEFMDLAKTPYQFAIRISGHFKETKIISIIEAIVNIIVSIALVKFFGIIGVAVGTVIAMTWRTIAYSIFVHNRILPTQKNKLFKYILFSTLVIAVSSILFKLIVKFDITNYYIFIVASVLAAIIVSFVLVIFSAVLFQKRSLSMIRTIRGLLFDRRRKR